MFQQVIFHKTFFWTSMLYFPQIPFMIHYSFLFDACTQSNYLEKETCPSAAYMLVSVMRIS